MLGSFRILSRLKWLVIAAFVFSPLQTLAVNTNACTGAGGTVVGDNCVFPNSNKSLFGNGSFFQSLTDLVIFIVGAVAVIMLIIGAMRFVLSNGDSKAVGEARNGIMYAIVGLIIAIAAYPIAHFVFGILSKGK
jgi:glucose uptake protein GlcU